jgi:hypothetical protein
MHRILLRTVCLDLAADTHEAGLNFWRDALAANPKRGVNFPEYHELAHPAAVVSLFVQQLGNDHGGPSRLHLDIESDDVDAEIGRLLELGATVIDEHRDTAVGDWVVLRDPGGLLFCITTATVDAQFEADSVRVG